MENRKAIVILSTVMAIALAVVSFFGAFDVVTYERDAASMAAQGAGQDLVNLVFVVPLLVFALIFMLRNSRIASFIFGGSVFYILYSFCIYAFGLHFNKFFLLYCLVLGSSLYSFILVILELTKMDVQNWFGEKVPIRLTGVYLLLISALFYILWFKDIIPAVLMDTIPKNVSNYNLLVNPVHVLDLSIALPGLILTAVLLMKKRRLGYILAPVLLVFVIILTIALAGMVMMTRARGITEDTSIAVIFIALAVISIVFLYLFLKNITVTKKGRA
ncbi:MAG: hypothetical protein OEY18_16055 [Candidatus Aminicenantes bacterium]|nr:hypothetical protein [Candidatus Aminicenantes bacterium]MDH5386214.1 hypothetical protein [Candidatus Aminicenantes bacterium]MDH5743148.1 hypothetical protein [Candidatus Aminicenantes bacterium]